MSTTQHVIIIGGGAMGACSTYYLSKYSSIHILVEKTEIVCVGSGKARGVLALDWYVIQK